MGGNNQVEAPVYRIEMLQGSMEDHLPSGAEPPGGKARAVLARLDTFNLASIPVKQLQQSAVAAADLQNPGCWRQLKPLYYPPVLVTGAQAAVVKLETSDHRPEYGALAVVALAIEFDHPFGPAAEGKDKPGCNRRSAPRKYPRNTGSGPSVPVCRNRSKYNCLNLYPSSLTQ